MKDSEGKWDEVRWIADTVRFGASVRHGSKALQLKAATYVFTTEFGLGVAPAFTFNQKTYCDRVIGRQ